MNFFNSIKDKPEMLTANDLMEIFPLSRSGVYELLRDPDFPKLHLGRRIIIPRDALIDWLNRRLRTELSQINAYRENNSVSEDTEENAVYRHLTKHRAALHARCFFTFSPDYTAGSHDVECIAR